MPKYERLLTTHDSVLLNQIGSYVCQAIIAIQQQQPELLHEKYRNIQWQSSSNQSALTAKFTEALSQTQDWDALVQKFQVYLKALLIPESFSSSTIGELIAKVQQLNPGISELNSSTKNITIHPSTSTRFLQKIGITVLLLDAENLQINADTEKFLTTVCTCPIQVKVAFANWSNRGKLDVELHERGYDLIHVPIGRDNADGKMIAFGSSIHERYPNAQEVLVCSSDKVMTNLCNHLQQNGLTVYQVSQQGENLRLFNSSTGKITTHSLKALSEIPSIEQLIQQLKTLIKAEQQSTGNQWVQVSKVSQLLQKKYKITITQVMSIHLPGKKARDIFIDYPAEFVVHQAPDKSELYVTLFELPQVSKSNSSNFVKQSAVKNQSLSSINSPEDLEEALIKMMNTLTSKSKESHIRLEILGAEFNKQYGEGITKILKRLQTSSTFIKFLQSSSYFTLEKEGKSYRVIMSYP
ncbi:NYN domain-containing protein [Cylindrospermum sp. FACHB-282]|uniref:NYN domain-containing protein n=1 Tax=Cylindrospermum sp. FACHB-282 TaxID=2692794 RepID=UPI001687CFBB|nr:NYN domain-containing protein [Cylindrospermum sp. FACHB-282]MBD2386514.1 NYN domain-containing protein [Cylindrospermum sp. FACHB-282]